MNREPAFDQPACEQAVAGEGRLARFGLDAVEVEGGGGLAAQVHQLRGARLHPARHFVGGDAGVDFSVPGRHRVLEVEVPQRVQGEPLPRGGDAGWIGEIEDRVALSAKRHALERGGQETRCPS